MDHGVYRRTHIFGIQHFKGTREDAVKYEYYVFTSGLSVAILNFRLPVVLFVYGSISVLYQTDQQ